MLDLNSDWEFKLAMSLANGNNRGETTDGRGNLIEVNIDAIIDKLLDVRG